MADADDDVFEDVQETPQEGDDSYNETDFDPNIVRTELPSGVDREILDDNILRGIVQYFTNHFKDAEITFGTYKTSDPLHALAFATMGFLRAMMSFTESDIKAAEERLKISQTLAASVFKKKGTLSQIGKMVSMSKWEPMKSEELDCAVIMAESSLLIANVLLFQDNLSAYVKAGLNLRKAWKTYQEVWKCYTDVPNSTSVYNEHTIGGIQFGIGNINMIFSMLPPRLLKIVSVFGFPSDRKEGLKLMSTAFDHGGIRSGVAGLGLMIYHIVLNSFYYAPDINYNIERGEYVIKRELARFPGSALHAWFHGRLLRQKRDLDAAITTFQNGIAAQDEWVQLKHLCYYDLGLTHLFNLDAAQARPFFEKLAQESEWSKAFYAYFVAVCLLTEGKIDLAMKKFSELDGISNRRLGGKVISEEQFVLRKAKTYCKGSVCGLILPDLEICYLWNGFTNQNREVLDLVVEAVNGALAQARSTKNSNNMGLCLLFLGAAYRQIEKYKEAIKCFEEIDSIQDSITEEKYVVPYSLYEHGSLLLLLNDVPTAEKLLNKARDKYKDYNFEVKLHMRLHLTMEAIRDKKK